MTKPTANEPTVLRGPNFRRHPERRELMIDAALEVFFNKGYDAARIEDVARLSGVGKSAVLYHFGSKLALLTDVVAKHCLPSSPLADGPAEHLIEAGLTDPAATRVLRFVMAEQRRLPSLARLYAIAILRRVNSWHVPGSIEAVRAGVSRAIGNKAVEVLFERNTANAGEINGSHHAV